MATEQLTSSVAVVVDEWVQRQYRNLNNVQVTASSVKVIQHLWGGFGILVRVAIDATSSGVAQRTVHHTDNEDEVLHSPPRLGPPPRSVVCKFINLPVSGSPSRGGRSLDVGDARKLKSYFVEAAFYRHFAVQLIDERGVRIPRPLKIQIDPRVTYDPHKPNDPTFFILSDLQLEGLDDPRPGPTQASITGALYWLAIFHASFLSQPEKLQQARQHLWENGCYWHLATRPDELAAIPQDSAFFNRANEWDAALHNAKFQTVCHGDAKLANFVFRRNSATAHASECGAVDFQYCGIGCGMSDVAYLLEDCVSCDTRAATDDTTALQRWEELTRPYLDTYFAALRRVLAASIEWDTIDALESEWRALFPVAHLDFWRFYLGWSSDARYKSEADLMKNVPPHIRCMASR